MPRFYFHTEDGRSFLDDDGTELPDLRTALLQAIKLFGEILNEDPSEILRAQCFRMTVTDEVRQTLFTIDLTALRPMRAHNR